LARPAARSGPGPAPDGGDQPDLPDLAADCAACVALCCIGLALDKGADFAIDKPAGTPCPNLSGHACRIHADLANRGFPGCARYDCEGAGQRSVALHGGASWRDDPDVLSPMLDTFSHLRRIHELLNLLLAAGRLPLEPDHEHERRLLVAALCPQEMTSGLAATLATGPIPGRARAFFRDLRRGMQPLRAATDRPTSSQGPTRRRAPCQSPQAKSRT
jgi:hypothetical protein